MNNSNEISQNNIHVEKIYGELQYPKRQQIYENAIVVDARKPSEYKAEHVEKAINIPLDYVNEQLAEVPKEDSFFLHCAGGYRSVIMSSIPVNLSKNRTKVPEFNSPIQSRIAGGNCVSSARTSFGRCTRPRAIATRCS